MTRHTADRPDHAYAPDLSPRELPHPDALTERRLRGTACVWCAGPLKAGAEVDLGVRQRPRVAHFAAWYPRACRPCAESRA